MFFSLSYYLFIMLFFHFWAAKLLISFELHKFLTIFFTFHFSLFTFFRTFAPKIKRITLFE